MFPSAIRSVRSAAKLLVITVINFIYIMAEIIQYYKKQQGCQVLESRMSMVIIPYLPPMSFPFSNFRLRSFCFPFVLPVPRGSESFSKKST